MDQQYKSPSPLQARHGRESGVRPRLIIHGGAGNIRREHMGHAKYAAYRHALLTIVAKTDSYINTPLSPCPSLKDGEVRYPSALEIAAYAVTLLEDNPLFNSGHGAVFTRDGVNELEASVMVSRGHAKRGVGVTGLRHVRNPILLAKAMLEQGDADLGGKVEDGYATASRSAAPIESRQRDNNEDVGYEYHDPDPAENDKWQGIRQNGLDIPSAQGHTLLHGETAEILAERYKCDLVDTSYFFTQQRWDDHVHALEQEKNGSVSTATWSADSFLPQGTCGAVALDTDGVLCVATSTGGMTNKLTGRIGDTPVVGAGFWAEEWEDHYQTHFSQSFPSISAVIELSAGLRAMLSDCLPTPFLYSPVHQKDAGTVTTRATAISGTGNGDSFARLSAVRTVAAMARWAGVSTATALNKITGRGGELEKSAGDRWGRTGEGEGGMIGIESIVTRDGTGRIVGTRAEILQDHNCAGMFRAWINDEGKAVFKIWHGQTPQSEKSTFYGEGMAVDLDRFGAKS